MGTRRSVAPSCRQGNRSITRPRASRRKFRCKHRKEEAYEFARCEPCAELKPARRQMSSELYPPTHSFLTRFELITEAPRIGFNVFPPHCR
jgi:hypothetical protein